MSAPYFRFKSLITFCLRWSASSSAGSYSVSERFPRRVSATASTCARASCRGAASSRNSALTPPSSAMPDRARSSRSTAEGASPS